MAVSVAGRGEDLARRAGRLLADSVESPKLVSSLAFRLPASCWEALALLPYGVMRLPDVIVGLLLFLARRSSFSIVGDT